MIECFGCGEEFDSSELKKDEVGDLYCESCVEFYEIVDTVDEDDQRKMYKEVGDGL